MKKITFSFVKNIPDKLEEGVLYISVEYATAIHSCCCGCGGRVVTPLSPAGWTLSFNGETVSLSPSIGNWSFKCRSHYWIVENRVEWARKWRNAEIADVRERDTEELKAHYKKKKRKSWYDIF